jgi:hypothetical protein
MIVVAPGTTSVSIDVQIVDDTGLPVTGLVAATFPALNYSKGTGADTSITLSDLSALTDAYSSGGVKERSGGVYRLDVPNGALSAAATKVVIRGEASGKRLITESFEVANLPGNVTQWSGTNVAAPATAGYPAVTLKVGTGTGEVNLSSGKAPATIAAGDMATDSVTAASVAAAAVTKIQAGLATPTNITAGTITTVTNVTTVNGLAAGVITAASIATDAIDADAIAASAVTEIQSGLASQASVNTIDDFLDTESAALTTAVNTIDGIVDAILVDTGTTIPDLIGDIEGGSGSTSSIEVPIGEHYVETGDSLAAFRFRTVNTDQEPYTYDDLELTLYIDGVEDATAITWTEVEEGLCQLAGTLPTITAGQRLRIEATTVEGNTTNDVWFGIVRAPNQSVITYVTPDEAESEGLNLLCKVGSLGVPKSVTTESDLTDWGAKVLVIERANNPRTDIQVIENADITISTVTAANDTFTFQPSSTVLDKPSDYIWSLREVSSGYVIAEGRLAVSYAALEDVP